jgi:hypothetical protein
VPADKIYINYERQRWPEPKHMKKLHGKWDINCVTPLQCRYDPKEDRYYGSDGQQHMTVWLIYYGLLTEVPCFFVETEDVNVESRQLLALNTDSEPMAKFFIHKQNCKMGDKASLAIEKAGCSMLLLEAVPSEVAGKIAERLSIPVLGIGAGDNVDGQLVIMHDLTGFYPTFRPWFAKCYIPEVISEYTDVISSTENIKKFGIDTRDDGIMFIVRKAIEKYCYEVKNKIYPSKEYIYPIKKDDLEKIKQSKYWY